MGEITMKRKNFDVTIDVMQSKTRKPVKNWENVLDKGYSLMQKYKIKEMKLLKANPYTFKIIKNQL